MSDYLTRLAERALGVAPAVRPKLPPRFAPPGRADADPDREWWAGEVRRAQGTPAPTLPGNGSEDPPA